MDIAFHSLSIANLAKPGFAEMILNVPSRHQTNDAIQRQIIGLIIHASQMSEIDQCAESKQMILNVAQRLFETATVSQLSKQDQAARLIIEVIAHANAMARLLPEVNDAIFATVRPIAQMPLARDDRQFDQLRRSMKSARDEIKNIAHSAQMARLVRSL